MLQPRALLPSLQRNAMTVGKAMFKYLNYFFDQFRTVGRDIEFIVVQEAAVVKVGTASIDPSVIN